MSERKKIRSVKKILDYNGDGKIDESELKKAQTDKKALKAIEKIDPLTAYLLRNQKVGITATMKQRRHVNARHSQTSLIRRSKKKKKNDVDLFKIP